MEQALSGATADGEPIRDFARSRIVEFKVPRHILRVVLAGKLGLV